MLPGSEDCHIYMACLTHLWHESHLLVRRLHLRHSDLFMKPACFPICYSLDGNLYVYFHAGGFCCLGNQVSSQLYYCQVQYCQCCLQIIGTTVVFPHRPYNRISHTNQQNYSDNGISYTQNYSNKYSKSIKFKQLSL